MPGSRMKWKVVASVLVAEVARAKTSFGNIIPNARRVVVDGVTAVGLGHRDLTIGFANENNANPFGLDVLAAEGLINDPDAFWAAVCDLDSDGDGILNKDELCDPNCNSAGRDIDCLDGKVLTHPGFPDAVDGDDGGDDQDEDQDEGDDDGVDEDTEVSEKSGSRGFVLSLIWIFGIIQVGFIALLLISRLTDKPHANAAVSNPTGVAVSQVASKFLDEDVARGSQPQHYKSRNYMTL